MIEKYTTICFLLEEPGDIISRLNKIKQIIRHPGFIYDKNSHPEILENTFLASSYWLDQELFEESYLYKMKKPYLLGMQKLHLRMVDIGVTLLDKGFPLKFEPEKYAQTGPHQLATCVKVFAEQCHKRHHFLHKETIHKKQNLPFINHQKTLA